MQTRRNSALALVLPHPPLPRRRTSYSSISSGRSPHTPRSSCGPQTPLMLKFENGSTRTSTDSWASSTAEVDDMEWEWTKEQLSLLAKTLDSLPQHVLTPYIGPIPPPNLLDKVSRSITQSKSSTEWPHSVRATRKKLIEVARAKHASSSVEDLNVVMSIPEEREQERDENTAPPTEDEGGSTIGKAAGRKQQKGKVSKGRAKSKETPARKPLYRQNSMDFLGDMPSFGESLPRLSTRLQRTSRHLASSTYHPYARGSLPAGSSPPLLDTPLFPHSIRKRGIRSRSSSLSISTVASSHSNPPTNPMNILPPIPPIPASSPAHNLRSRTSDVAGKLKRAPSYGTTAVQEKMKEMKLEGGGISSVRIKSSNGAISSDEEEKARSIIVKRPRTRTRSGESTEKEGEDKKTKKKSSRPNVNATSEKRSRRATVTAASASSFMPSGIGMDVDMEMPMPSTTTPTTKVRSKVRVRHSDSMFGAALPLPIPCPPPPPPLPVTDQIQDGNLITPPLISSPTLSSPTQQPPIRTLRRVTKTQFPPRACRKISFGKLRIDENVESSAGKSSTAELGGLLASAFEGP